jgi:DNA-binding MarR family transcriptional regulator
MQAAAPGTDVREMETARLRADGNARPADDPRRLVTPPRSRARSLRLVSVEDAEHPAVPSWDAASPPSIELQRARTLVAAAEAVRKFPLEGLDLANGNGRAALAREAIEDHQQGSEACHLEAFEQVLALAERRASAAYDAQEGWLDRVRAGLLALLQFFDDEPTLARYIVVHSAQSGEAVLARRLQVLDRLVRVLDDEHAPRRSYPPPLTAQALLSGVLGVLEGQLRNAGTGALVELAGPLMSFIVLPFLDVATARRELSRPADATGAAERGAPLELLAGRGGHISFRTVSVLRVIATESGLSNKEIALRAGVRDEGQISRVLARLARLGLLQSARDPLLTGATNAWRLTPLGAELEAAVRHEAPVPERRVALELPHLGVSRLDYRTPSLLRVLGEQPGLATREVALRAGFAASAPARSILSRLERLGLVQSTPQPGRRGTAKVWQLTAGGVQLDEQLARKTPARRRSAAVELMRESGGRLSERAVSVLRAVGVQPGISNRGVAARVGLSAELHVSRLLARLREQGLIENTRNGGRENAWRLTPSGKRLHRAIACETPAAPPDMARALIRASGVRLNHRSLAVLTLIAREPGLSNTDIALRAGIESTGHASTLLARLARHGLIESARISGRRNAWHLTAGGERLTTAIGQDPKLTATGASGAALTTHP